MPCFVRYRNICCTSWQMFYNLLQWDLFSDFVVLLCICIICYHIWKAFIYYQLNFVLNSKSLCLLLKTCMVMVLLYCMVVLLCICLICLPYLKSFHLLPVKFRIEFKIALLTLKNLYGYAPTNLKFLINSRSVSARYCLRVNNDNWLLQTVTSLNFFRSQSMFSYALTRIWNSLPPSQREIETLHFFKKRLKTFYFNLFSLWGCYHQGVEPFQITVRVLV